MRIETSTRTGRRPARTMAWATANELSVETSTRDPGGRPRTSRASSRAVVPEETATAWLAPTCRANSDSNARTSGPLATHPVASARAAAVRAEGATYQSEKGIRGKVSRLRPGAVRRGWGSGGPRGSLRNCLTRSRELDQRRPPARACIEEMDAAGSGLRRDQSGDLARTWSQGLLHHKCPGARVPAGSNIGTSSDRAISRDIANQMCTPLPRGSRSTDDVVRHGCLRQCPAGAAVQELCQRCLRGRWIGVAGLQSGVSRRAGRH